MRIEGATNPLAMPHSGPAAPAPGAPAAGQPAAAPAAGQVKPAGPAPAVAAPHRASPGAGLRPEMLEPSPRAAVADDTDRLRDLVAHIYGDLASLGAVSGAAAPADGAPIDIEV